MIVFGGGFDESKGGGSILGNAFQVVDNVIHGRGGTIRKDFFDHWYSTSIADVGRVSIKKVYSMGDACIGVAL